MGNSFTPALGFRSEKAAQIAAYLLRKSGGKLDKLALAKLFYIVERDSVRLRNRPMIYDECFSLKDGPVCKSALDGLNGHIDEDIWLKYVHQDGRRDVYLDTDAPCELDQLSSSDRKVLDGVLAAHEGKDGGELRAWTHDPRNVPEYTLVTGKDRIPISYQEMAKAVGVKHPGDVSENELSYRRCESVFPRK